MLSIKNKISKKCFLQKALSRINIKLNRNGRDVLQRARSVKDFLLLYTFIHL